jgi:hypothetical protein
MNEDLKFWLTILGMLALIFAFAITVELKVGREEEGEDFHDRS